MANNINLESQSMSSADEEVTLKNLFLKIGSSIRYLYTKRWLIILVTVVGACSGFFYSRLQKNIYTASTTFVVEDGGDAPALGGLGGLASMVGLDLSGGGSIFQGDNLLELYKSRSMIQKTLLSRVDSSSNQRLIDLYININKLRENWSSQPELFSVKFHERYEDNKRISRLRDSLFSSVIKDISKNYLSVSKVDKKLNILKVEVKSNNEQFAKCFSNQIVKNVNDFYIETKSKRSVENLQILQHKTDSVRNVMNGAIYSSIAIADRTPNVNPTREILKVAPIQKSQFSAETNKLLLAELVKNLEMSKIAVSKDMPLIQVIDEPVYPLPLERLGLIKAILLFGTTCFILVCLSLMITKFIRNTLTS
ncbi:Wzz/FepE/Etk N-terminal domain-containing protein [Pedobacter sp. SYP-B3415]|uniref:Wzz/FepE/Etk N-terminal domain-containing protein n=1 Tax=Pedobacter sp. SYP-B3415 TaxID=2496641 RepID=UPI00101CDB9D|nr:Wzz/FepE/Etk N-terminal domain-containing protein [Pedobacter sp. SYP-B3415]